MDKTTLVIAFFAAAILAGLFVQYGGSIYAAVWQQEKRVARSE